MIASFVFLYGLIGCGPPSGNVLHSIDVSSDESGNVDFTHVDDTSAHEPFEPGVAAGFWQQRLQYDIGNQEMMRVQKAADVTLRSEGKGRLHASPTVDVSVTGGFTGSANFTALVRTKVTARYSVSNTPPIEKVEEYLFQDHVGIFTDSNKVSGHFRQECKTLCREGRYEISGTVNLLAYPMSKRRDICHMMGNLQHTSDSKREQYCFVWQKNPEDCMISTHGGHPIAGCEYHPAILVGRVTTEIACHFDSGWTCAVKNHQAAECSEAKAEPGSSNFCDLILDILTPREPWNCGARGYPYNYYRTQETCLSAYNLENFQYQNPRHWSAAWIFDQERKNMTQALLEQHCVW